MATYLPLNTGSQVVNADGSNRTGTALSTQIVIKVGTQAVGAIKSLNVSETRNVEMISELGTDGNIDSTPTKATDYSAKCERVRFDRLRVTEAFSRAFLHVKSQRVPFDIDIYDRWGSAPNEYIRTTLKNCWVTNIDYTYNSDGWIITDSMQIKFEDIYSDNNGNPAAQGGTRGLTLNTDAQGVERDTDRGSRRGALDVAGLITDTQVNL